MENADKWDGVSREIIIQYAEFYRGHAEASQKAYNDILAMMQRKLSRQKKWWT